MEQSDLEREDQGAQGPDSKLMENITITEVKAKKFWMVKRMGDNSTKKTYGSKDEAVQEAQRLCYQEPGVVFFVMEAAQCYVVELSPVKEVRLEG